jgi:hypothetical protein
LLWLRRMRSLYRAILISKKHVLDFGSSFLQLVARVKQFAVK